MTTGKGPKDNREWQVGSLTQVPGKIMACVLPHEGEGDGELPAWLDQE